MLSTSWSRGSGCPSRKAAPQRCTPSWPAAGPTTPERDPASRSWWSRSGTAEIILYESKQVFNVWQNNEFLGVWASQTRIWTLRNPSAREKLAVSQQRCCFWCFFFSFYLTVTFTRWRRSRRWRERGTGHAPPKSLTPSLPLTILLPRCECCRRLVCV